VDRNANKEIRKYRVFRKYTDILREGTSEGQRGGGRERDSEE
jgi:hypothetical protein